MSDKPLLIAAPYPQIWSRIFSVDDLDLILRGLPPIRMQPAQPATVKRFSSKPANPAIGK